MTQIQLTNTATRRKEVFQPLDVGDVRMYLCGPTVYDRAHLGNARPVIMFDVLFRLLRYKYGPQNVTYVRNYTDIDDKIIARATEQARPIETLTAETIGWYEDDMITGLGTLPPTHSPRATDYVPQMVAMIEDLIAKGHAYAAQGHVLFKVRSYPDYGQLSGRALDDMIAGARVEVAPYKEDPLDFVLWKPSNEGEPGWTSPWGRGRPGWHIECSAMARDLLGESFDIHGGGLDLQFPHHENEIAQSKCACTGDFAQVWLHNEMLQVEGKKMSKSLGNFFTVRDLLDQGIPGDVIRFVLLSTHYSKPMDWTEKRVEEARKRLTRWYRLTENVDAAEKPAGEVYAALAHDLNTSLALAEMDKLAAANSTAKLKNSMQLIGLPEAEDVTWHQANQYGMVSISATGTQTVDDPHLKSLLNKWQMLRNDQSYEDADALKDQMEATGLRLSSLGSGPHAEKLPNFDPIKLADIT
ncbi:MAG: cysteine--tRNA ligase [Pseudomonadota bacterium]